MKRSTITVNWYDYGRIGLSVNGNPTFLLYTDQGTFRTSSDAAISYEVTNWFGYDTSQRTRNGVTFELTAAGYVTDIYRLYKNGRKARK